MGFTFIHPVFVLVIGSLFPVQSVSLELLWSTPIEHHRTIRADPNAGDNGIPGQCPIGPGWKHNNGNSFYFSSLVPNVTMKDWTQAEAACKMLGGKTEMKIRLAELGGPDNCKSDNWLMQQITAKGEQVWLGATFSNTILPGTWTWATSKRELSKDNAYWGPCQPNNHDGMQNCLSTLHGKAGCKRQYLNDATCTTPCHYVCQCFNKTSAPLCEDKKC